MRKALKPLLANVVAVLAEEGRLSLNANITDYVHELAETAYAGATLAYRSQYFRPAGPDGPFYAAGAAGQYCYIHPACDTVIVKFATHGGVDPELGKLELHAFRQIAENASS